MFGQHNQLSNCSIQGKKTKGQRLLYGSVKKTRAITELRTLFWRASVTRKKTGGETIRLDDSSNSMRSANCIIENNLFEHCDGETECISNKSCDNIYRSNTFREVQGTLTLRHGNRCLVENNIFFGNKRNQTGGIRIIGEDHRILNNYLVP